MIVVTPLSPKPLTNIKYKSKQDSKAFLFEVKKKKRKVKEVSGIVRFFLQAQTKAGLHLLHLFLS